MVAPDAPSQPMTDHPEYWMARGVGKEYDLVCLVTGEAASLMSNVSGFVQGREAGERVVTLFNGRARLDFRKHEPDWVQVKVGCLPEHEEVLHRLCQASWGCHGLLNERIIKWAVDPIQFPGGEPKALARANANSLEAASLRSQVSELRNALGFYADKDNYATGFIVNGMSRHVMQDYGDKARTALAVNSQDRA